MHPNHKWNFSAKKYNFITRFFWSGILILVVIKRSFFFDGFDSSTIVLYTTRIHMQAETWSNIIYELKMNERTHLFTKIYLSHFILERDDVSVVCDRWVERHMLRERPSSSYIFFQEPRVANAYTFYKFVREATDRLRVPRSTAILCILS